MRIFSYHYLLSCLLFYSAWGLERIKKEMTE